MKFLESILNILLPVLVVLENNIGFFFLVSVYLIFILSYYCYSFYSYCILPRIFKTIMILILLLHHFSFMLIYLTDIIRLKYGVIYFLN